MAFLKDRLIVHLGTDKLVAYEYKECNLQIICTHKVNLKKEFVKNNEFKEIDSFIENLKKGTEFFTTEHIKIYATGIFYSLDFEDRNSLINHVYIAFGLYVTIIPPDLESFYLEKSICKSGCANMVEGLINQEFRKVVVCGSFKHSIREMEKLINVLHAQNIDVLSPTTTKQRPETLGSSFVLFEGQELINERDGWRHQFLHISQFIKADAIIICNPGGIVGKGALFELGYLTSILKRIIFTENPIDLSMCFPYEVGLNF